MNLLCEASGENYASYSPSHFIQVNLFPGECSSLALSHFEIHLVEFPSSVLALPFANLFLLPPIVCHWFCIGHHGEGGSPFSYNSLVLVIISKRELTPDLSASGVL